MKTTIQKIIKTDKDLEYIINWLSQIIKDTKESSDSSFTDKNKARVKIEVD